MKKYSNTPGINISRIRGISPILNIRVECRYMVGYMLKEILRYLLEHVAEN